MEMNLAVTQIITETHDTKTLRFERPEGFDLIPGQFVKLFAREARRAYSIASSPAEPVLDLTVRRMQSGLVSPFFVDEVKVGDQLRMAGPYGRFVAEEKPMVWIAGGSGIVPFRSMWRHTQQNFVLVYAVKTQADIIYRAELEKPAAAGKPIVQILTAEAPSAWRGYLRRVDAEILREVGPDIDSRLFYACGPPAMCDDVLVHLARLGVPQSSIRVEKYD